MATRTIDLLITGASELLTMEGGFGIVRDGAIAIHKKKIVAVGTTSDVTDRYTSKSVVDARGKVVTPGLIDCHTHLIYAGSREQEHQMRLKGKTYLQILHEGGGILSTVAAVRSASKAHLISHGKKWLKEFFKHGVTTVEIKSGYGLDYENEKKILEAIYQLKKEVDQDIVATFLGAHTYPNEHRNNHAGYIKEITDRMLPDFQNLADFCDIFVEKGAFSVGEADVILRKAKHFGYGIKMHVNQLSSLGGIALARKYNTVSVDHIDHLSQRDLALLAKMHTVAVLLPGASYFLQQKPRYSARALLDRGISVALSTDFNPGSCPSPNLGLMMSFGVQTLGMQPEEVWQSVTSIAARAIGRAGEVGSLAVGKKAHIVIWNMPSYLTPFYHFGINFVEKVIL